MIAGRTNRTRLMEVSGMAQRVSADERVRIQEMRAAGVSGGEAALG